jgi:hypothetical protein
VKKIFTDVTNPAGFASPTKVWKKAQTVIPSFTHDQVKNILQSIESYT